jgi:putative ABC transport system substrate-binding protein
MRRREFITLVGGAVSWAPPAVAQQSVRVPRIAVISNLNADDPEFQARHAAFLRGLQEAGWIIGRNVQIDIRSTLGDAARTRRVVEELVSAAPAVIFTVGSATVAPLLQMTQTIPIVFVVVPDPVAAGFVDSMARPGGNATGFSEIEYSQSGKWLEFLKQIAPSVKRVAIIRDPAITAGIGQFAAIQTVAQSF